MLRKVTLSFLTRLMCLPLSEVPKGPMPHSWSTRCACERFHFSILNSQSATSQTNVCNKTRQTLAQSGPSDATTPCLFFATWKKKKKSHRSSFGHKYTAACTTTRQCWQWLFQEWGVEGYHCQQRGAELLRGGVWVERQNIARWFMG